MLTFSLTHYSNIKTFKTHWFKKYNLKYSFGLLMTKYVHKAIVLRYGVIKSSRDDVKIEITLWNCTNFSNTSRFHDQNKHSDIIVCSADEWTNFRKRHSVQGRNNGITEESGCQNLAEKQRKNVGENRKAHVEKKFSMNSYNLLLKEWGWHKLLFFMDYIYRSYH